MEWLFTALAIGICLLVGHLYFRAQARATYHETVADDMRRAAHIHDRKGAVRFIDEGGGMPVVKIHCGQCGVVTAEFLCLPVGKPYGPETPPLDNEGMDGPEWTPSTGDSSS